MSELERLQTRFGQFLVMLLWAHVPLIALVAAAAGRPPAPTAIAAAVLAGAYHLSWRRCGIAPVTRYLSAVALVGEPALLIYLLAGQAWQMDLHMYYFATLALTIGWCDWRVIVLAAAAIAFNHLVLNLLLPFAVFAQGPDLGRVGLHGLVVAFEASVLIWLANRLTASFARIARLTEDISHHNDSLEQRVWERSRELEAANRAKSLFLANMSHEIRTPMNAILGFCHLLLRTALNQKQQDHIFKMKNACVSLLDLIDEILDLSKIEAGKLSLECADFDLRAVLAGPLGIAGVKAAEKNLSLSLDIAPDVPDVLYGDASRLNQVVLNLVTNAIKFTDRGSVSVSIAVLERLGRSIVLQAAVRDTGVGLSVEQQARLFRPFSQVDDSHARRAGGTGLGLAISKQLVELMGGTIAVESRPASGSVFTFNVRLEIGDQSLVTARVPPDAIRHLRVLIVDDNPASREILQDMFAVWCMHADLVASGREALAALQAATEEGFAYDCVLIDWKMPGMDGIETVKAMRRLDGLTELPTVLMVSVDARGEEKADSEVPGIAGFLLKPIDPTALLNTLLGLFGPKPAETERRPAQPASTPMVAPHLRGARVLLADDNAINREIAFELLSSAGLLVDVVADGQAACARALDPRIRYGAILMDVQMREMDGLEATARIRQHLGKDRLPIIALTAHAYEVERQRCLEAGMNDHLAKPVDPAALVAVLDRWLDPAAVAQAAPNPPPPPSQDAGLPTALSPFDLDAALVRVDGNEPLLRKLILDFADTFGGIIPTLRDRIADAALAEARFHAHTLRGVALVLELRAVAEAAGEMEAALASADLPSLELRLMRLERALRPALDAAATLDVQPAGHAARAQAVR